jgi:hypothetical protein
LGLVAADPEKRVDRWVFPFDDVERAGGDVTAFRFPCSHGTGCLGNGRIEKRHSAILNPDAPGLMV